ncbi:carboxylate-amine ligase [Thalassoroseus pseudoceratinae]|uniref:carboxylate-amine ligase n=1 Tax=Thalassoroseus pseudoceratinae TaxID=2713176 RepID=UPI001420C0B8|nr:YbdK family carboxylate-amine ligase [Thalassoroseus pseudoceratinae]
MSVLRFTHNDRPSIGVEIELQLVDETSYALRPAIEAVLGRLPKELHQTVKPELMQSYLEINTGVCNTVRDVGRDLSHTLEELEKVTDAEGLKLLWAATHPFSRWEDQAITVNDRYFLLVDLMQDVARRLVTFGLHVHIGVDSGDKAVMICDRMLRHLPLLLALSSNSPFWNGRRTGLASSRSKIMEDLPTAGLPHQMRNWSEYVWLINHLMDTGFINTIREIWWDIRPHHNFGTVEIRVCDVPANLQQVLALTALVQCLVTAIDRQIDEGTYFAEYHPMMVQQNKWRATRYGSDAQLVDSDNYKQRSVEETTNSLVEYLQPIAEELNCVEELGWAEQLPHETGSRQQLHIFDTHVDAADDERLRRVVQEMINRNDWRQFEL